MPNPPLTRRAPSLDQARDCSQMRILVYRLGSLGDTIIVLPALRAVAAAYPGAKITLLTNIPVNSKASAMTSLLENTGLIADVIAYPLGLRDVSALVKLVRQLRQKRFDVAVDLAAARGRSRSVRDWWFLRAAGAKKIVGVPWTAQDLELQPDPQRAGQFEWEAERLARRVASLKKIDLAEARWWDLALTAEENATARAMLAQAGINGPFIVASVGTKVDAKDWTQPNWEALFTGLAKRYPDYGLVFFGVTEESPRSQACLRLWPGPALDLCGKTSPRLSAAIMRGAKLFIGHDSGPMHLAAAVGVPCVAIFSSRSPRGQWDPHGGTRNRILYREIACQGCRLDVCTVMGKRCILSITVGEVTGAIGEVLGPGKDPARGQAL